MAKTDKILIYLDWNIFSYIFNYKKIKNEKILEGIIYILELVRDNPEKVILPYSDAHLHDIAPSIDTDNEVSTFALRDLEKLDKLTESWCLCKYWGEKDPRLHKRSAMEFFESTLKEREGLADYESLESVLKETTSKDVLGAFNKIPHGMDFKFLDSTMPEFAKVLKRSRSSDSMDALIKDVCDLFIQMDSNPNVYRELSGLFRDYLQIPSDIGKKRDFKEEAGEKFKSVFDKGYDEFFDDLQKGKGSSEYSDDLITDYLNLDFVGYSADKISKKNRYGNLFNDAKHCFYASYCNIYISNDRRTIEKAKQLFGEKEISTEVFSLEEFRLHALEKKNKHNGG